MTTAQPGTGTGEACPRCGAPMVERINRDTAEHFLGCARFPECRGTRQISRQQYRAAGGPRRARIRLNSGHRQPRDVGDYSELVVARILGRNLTPMQGCAVQILGAVVFAMAFYWFIASGTMTQLIKVFADWYAGYVMQTLTATPAPS